MQDEITTVKAACSYCGVGCGMILEVATDTATGARRVVKATGDRDHPTNRGRLCTKGATSAEMLAGGGRLESAWMRPAPGAEAVPVTVDEAITATARGLRAIVDEHGPDAVALYVSGQMSLEAQYLANKLAKGYIRTSGIESNSRLCMAAAGTGYKQSLGADGPPGSYEDFDHADVFFVIGSNMADCHPILFLRMMDRVEAGAKLIVVDPRRTATADKADLFLQISPGTDLALLNGLLHLLVQSGHTDPAFIEENTVGWEAMGPFLDGFAPDVVAASTGLSADDIRTAARWIGEAGNWMTCWTMGLNQSVHGTWNTNAICNLHLATGAICRTGSGPFSLTGQPNAMGGREMGYMGPGLPGQRSVLSGEDRAFVEQRWDLEPGTLRTEVSSGTIDMFRRMAEREIKACWIICTNPVATVANRRTVLEALENAELVITQDAFLETETNAYADIVLPAAMWSESEYVTVGSDRTLNLNRQATDPVGGSLPDWQIIARVATEMGYGHAFDYSSASEIFDEIVGFDNPATGYDLRGIDHERLRNEPVQWPCPPGGAAHNPIRYVEPGEERRLRFATPDGRARFFARPHLPAAELPDDDYPMTLNTGRVQHQWHTLTKTGRVSKLGKLAPGPFVEINPEDARNLGVQEGDRVVVESRRGSATLPAVVTDRVAPGCCFAPFHWNDTVGDGLAINAVTSDATDPESHQPEFKVCAVRLVKVVTDLPAGEAHMPDALGLQDVAAPVFDESERMYLAGVFAGVASAESSTVPVLPASAPLTPSKRLWVDGLLAGMYSRCELSTPSMPGSEAQDSGASGATVVTWASQTGTAEEFARVCAERLRGTGRVVREIEMSDVDRGLLESATELLVFSSTFGDGDPPDNGAAFWTLLDAEDAPSLMHIRYSVLAFGDSSYRDFCGHGRRLDERLAELGAVRLVPRTDCEPDYTDAAEAWLAAAVTELSGPGAAVSVATTATPSEPYSRRSPLVTRLTCNVPLSGAGSSKDVRQFGFELYDRAFEYEAGDALGVVPVNREDAVDEWFQVTALDPEAPIELDGLPTLSLREAAFRHLDITRVTPALLELVQKSSGSAELAKLLRPGNKIELEQWLWGRQAMDVIGAYPFKAELVEWTPVLGRLQPRLYSISSSPKVSPREVQLTVSVVRYAFDGRERSGVCSSFLADHSRGVDIPIFVQRNKNFRPPASPDTPMIMVGPGTGIAPFRGFLQERRALGHTGRNWLFFGDQKSDSDYLYRDELEVMHVSGFLTELDVAFSRDSRRKVYVQNRMLEHGAQLWRWLEDGAHFYVCGDASRMARDVDATLRDVVQAHGRMERSEADAYVDALVSSKRYVRDVY